MVTKDGFLTKKEDAWLKQFKKMLKSAPKGIELIVNNSKIEVYPSGTLTKHMGSEYDSFGIDTNPELAEQWIDSFGVSILIPYSEGQ